MNATGCSFSRLVFISIFIGLASCASDAAIAEATRANVAEWSAKNRSEHQTEWSSVRYATNPATGRVRATTNSYVEIGTSLNRMDPATGHWEPSDPSFQVTDAGVEANWTGHRVRISGNINSAGAVQIERDAKLWQGFLYSSFIQHCVEIMV